MQGEQADPAGHVNGILVGVIAMLGNFIRNVVDDDDPVEHDQDDEHQYSQGNVIKYHRFLPS
ncbi:hypothetical protein D3C86_1470070 [compost metagenome]